MLYKILEAHGGELPNDVVVTFANTGKEMPQTLDFVQDCSDNWGVDIVWLEYDGKKSFKEVNHATSAINGEPFAQLITDKKYLPNMVARFCTQELKVLTINRYLASQGIEDFLTVVGIRADEQRRVAKMRAKANYLVPLADAGVTKDDIFKFWEGSDFDLMLPNERGVNSMGNCDLCFLKGGSIKMSILAQEPRLADWWIDQEERIGARFRSDQPSYKEMKVFASDQMNMFSGDDESISCFCGD